MSTPPGRQAGPGEGVGSEHTRGHVHDAGVAAASGERAGRRNATAMEGISRQMSFNNLGMGLQSLDLDDVETLSSDDEEEKRLELPPAWSDTVEGRRRPAEQYEHRSFDDQARAQEPGHPGAFPDAEAAGSAAVASASAAAAHSDSHDGVEGALACLEAGEGKGHEKQREAAHRRDPRSAVIAGDLPAHDPLGLTGNVTDPSEMSLNVAELTERCGGDLELVEAVMLNFVDQGESTMVSLRDAVAIRDVKQLLFDCDFISGASRNVSAHKLATAVDDLIQRLNAANTELGNGSENDNGTFDVATRRNIERAVMDVRWEFEAAVESWYIWQELMEEGADGNQGDGDDIEDDETRLARYIAACGSVDSHDSGRWSATDNEDTRMNEILSNQEARKSSVQSGAAAEQGSDSPLGNQSAVTKKRMMNDFFLNAATIIQKMGQLQQSGERGALKQLAGELLSRAMDVGANGIAKKARILFEEKEISIRQSHIQAVEQQFDATKALWECTGLTV